MLNVPYGAIFDFVNLEAISFGGSNPSGNMLWTLSVLSRS